MSATLLPNAETQFIDANGKPLAGGSVYFYIPNTTTPKSTWQDSAQTILNTNPVILDGAGRAIIWGSGVYRQVVYDQFGNLIWDQITEDMSGGLIGDYTDNTYVSGVDFTPGVTTQLSISSSPGSADNLLVFFDGTFQTVDTYILAGNIVTFTSPIPVGVNKVTIKAGNAVSIGTPGSGTVTDSSVAPNSKLAHRISMWFDVKDYGAVGNGTADDTASIQATITAASSVGGIVFFSPGRYLCGSLTWNMAKGGSIFAIESTAFLIPTADNVTFFTLTNSTVGKPSIIDGLGFDNTVGKANVTCVSLSNFYQVEICRLYVKSVKYVVVGSATTQSCYNIKVHDITQYGTGSYRFVATAPSYIFDINMYAISQFTTGGDTWGADLFLFQRCVNSVLANIDVQAIGGVVNGVHCIGDCQGIFMSNMIIVQPAYGLLTDQSNGDAALPSYIYGSNFAVDQPTIAGASLLAMVCKFSNCNFTFGDLQSNSGPGFQVVTGSFDIVVEGCQIRNMNKQGVQVQAGTSQIVFNSCWISNNGTVDIDIIANTARDPMFRDCYIPNPSIAGGSMVINGGSTSRYIFSNRTQMSSAASASNQVLESTTLSANSLVDKKTLRITASGSFAANANTKAVTFTVGGITVATQSGTYSGVSWKMTGDIYRIDSNDVWMVGESVAGTAASVSSTLQTPFNSASTLVANLLVTGTAAADVVVHHFDIELID